jgi:hypothetical protein
VRREGKDRASCALQPLPTLPTSALRHAHSLPHSAKLELLTVHRGRQAGRGLAASSTSTGGWLGAVMADDSANAAGRAGHRPLLSTLQALSLTAQLFGVHPDGCTCADGAGSNSNSSADAGQSQAPQHQPCSACQAAAAAGKDVREMASYDDRNFYVRGACTAAGQTGPSHCPQGKAQQDDRAAKRLRSSGAPTDTADQSPPPAGVAAGEGDAFVLKVHNSQDACRGERLRVRSDGVCPQKECPLSPTQKIID